MKKLYKVECAEVTNDMIAGREPWNNFILNIAGEYTEAETPEEAIDVAMHWIVEDCQNNETVDYVDFEYDYVDIDPDREMVLYYNYDGDILGGFASFQATEIEYDKEEYDYE